MAQAGFAPSLRDGRSFLGARSPDFIPGYSHILPTGRLLGFVASHPSIERIEGWGTRP